MTISRVHGFSDCIAGLPLPLLPIGSTRLVEVFGRSELVKTSGSSESAIDGGSVFPSIWSISLIFVTGEPVEEDDDDIPFSSMARMQASMSRLE